MPAGLTIFVATYLVFIEAGVAVLILGWLAYNKPRGWLVRWAVAAILILALSYIFAKIGGAVYRDPRPFTQDHVKPLISHARDNGFPSDHALLAAALVALLLFTGDWWWAVPLAVMAVLVDWARVGSGLHHVVDVVGSSLFVLVAILIAVAATPFVVSLLYPHLPAAFREGLSPQRDTLKSGT
ncbi:MAG TPA: phosphatase PAP2 family protein [Chloroflexota bacterium]|nr:phosphatase PAP2 family protein [Chloroflexota bacterium]